MASQQNATSRANILSKSHQKLTFQPPKSKAAKVTETVTLDDDDDDDDVTEVTDADDNEGDGEIMLDGAPELEVIEVDPLM